MKTINLHLNESPFTPSEEVLRALKRVSKVSNRYPEWDAITLRSALARRMKVPPEWLVTAGTGSIGLIQQAMVASGQGGIAYGWPSFEAFDIAAKALRMPISHVALRNQACDLDALAQAITPGTTMVIICTPNAPTGGIVRHHDLEAFMLHVPPHVLVLIDEAYGEFVDDPEHVDSMYFVRKHPNVLLTRTFSKAYGLAGMRVGYGVAQPRLAARVAKAGLPFPVPAPFQAAALAALHDTKTLEHHIRTISAERHRLADKLRALGAEVVDGYGNFVWLPVGNAAERVVAAFREQAVLVKPVLSHGVRISIGTADETEIVCRAWVDGNIGRIASSQA
jgi:histidinol-phosphate aminotransferase